MSCPFVAELCKSFDDCYDCPVFLAYDQLVFRGVSLSESEEEE